MLTWHAIDFDLQSKNRSREKVYKQKKGDSKSRPLYILDY